LTSQSADKLAGLFSSSFSSGATGQGTIRLWGANGKGVQLGETRPTGKLTKAETAALATQPAHAPEGPMNHLRRSLFARARKFR
jgi:type VI secretion system secreted protein VgrG